MHDTMTLLIGQNEANWIGLLSSAVNVGFSVVVGIYLLTKAIPQMQADHSKALTAEREAFLGELRQKRADFIGEIKAIKAEFLAEEKDRRADYKETVKSILDHCIRENSHRDEMVKNEMQAVVGALREQGEVMEEVRDVLRDIRATKH